MEPSLLSNRRTAPARPIFPSSARRRGVVLIAVLALTALAAAIALEVAYIGRIEGERARSARARAIAEIEAWSGTRAALNILQEDDPAIDAEGDAWTIPLALRDASGHVDVTITDESGRFPLQSLFENGLLNIGAKTRLERILAAQNLPPELLDRLIDYSDADDIRFPLGAEAADYLAQNPPRRPANRPLWSLEELALVLGVSDSSAASLSPLLTLWGGPTININTAPADVLVGLVGGLQLRDAERIVARRRSARFTDVAQVRDVIAMTGAQMGEFTSNATVATGIFRIEARGFADNTDAVLTSIVERQPGGFVVKYRRLQ